MARRAIGHYNTLNENRSDAEQTVYAEFGRRLQARMIQLGWNQSELSRRATAHLPRPTKGQVQGYTLGRDRISSYIRGKYLPRPEGLEAIANLNSTDFLDTRIGVMRALNRHVERVFRARS